VTGSKKSSPTAFALNRIADIGFLVIPLINRRFSKLFGKSRKPQIFVSATEEECMKKIKITVKKVACYQDLIDQYENPLEDACDMKEGQVFIANGWQKPQGFCDSAWESLSPFVLALAHGSENFYDGWMKNKKSAMISCNDGFRPVSFLLETMKEGAE
jgi:uncharacterized repeat protein (TIGR04076 family)